MTKRDMLRMFVKWKRRHREAIAKGYTTRRLPRYPRGLLLLQWGGVWVFWIPAILFEFQSTLHAKAQAGCESDGKRIAIPGLAFVW